LFRISRFEFPASKSRAPECTIGFVLHKPIWRQLVST